MTSIRIHHVLYPRVSWSNVVSTSVCQSLIPTIVLCLFYVWLFLSSFN